MAFINEWLLQGFNQREGFFETYDSGSQFDEWMHSFKSWMLGYKLFNHLFKLLS
jgi:hypothetical protein